MTEKTFQAAVTYGSTALVIAAILNVWVVMRYVEVYRNAALADAKVQELIVREQALKSVAQEFAARSNTDPQIAAIFKRVQAMIGASVGVPPADVNRQPGAGR